MFYIFKTFSASRFKQRLNCKNKVDRRWEIGIKNTKIII